MAKWQISYYWCCFDTKNNCFQTRKSIGKREKYNLDQKIQIQNIQAYYKCLVGTYTS